MPRADDLFRPTAVPDPPDQDEVALTAAAGRPGTSDDTSTPERHPSGRVRHDEKMTVYMTSDELIDLEQARITLRRAGGSSVDRGRIVRAAVALALADLDENGPESALAQRLYGA